MFNKLLDPEGSKLPRLCELGPQIGFEVQRLETLALPQFAAEVMNRAFRPDYMPGGGMVGIGEIADCFLPAYGPERLGDVTSQEEYALRDLIAEAVQLLEHARLVRPKFGYGGGLASYGWVTTRLGRSALATGDVQNALDRLGALTA